MPTTSPSQISEKLRESLVASGGRRKVKIKTLLKMFGYQKRSMANTIELTRLLASAQISVSPPLIRLGETWGTTPDDWAHLEVDGPKGPRVPGDCLLPNDFDRTEVEDLQDRARNRKFHTEADVSYKFVVPLLGALGFSEWDRDDQPTIPYSHGSKRQSLRPDHIAYNRDTEDLSTRPLLVVEAKKKEAFEKESSIIHAGQQAKSYSDWIGCSRFLITDAVKILAYDRDACLAEIGKLRPSLILDCRDLLTRFNELYSFCSKPLLSQERRLSELDAADL